MAPTIVIGLSRAVSVLPEGNITDTIIHAVAGLLEGKSPVITLLIIYAFVTLFNFFVSSGSGKAVVMMPILQPLGQVLGKISRSWCWRTNTATASPTPSGPPLPCFSSLCAVWTTATGSSSLGKFTRV
ncbi:MAG: hypothetical protein V8S11_01690 [Flavonifractor plautii]